MKSILLILGEMYFSPLSSWPYSFLYILSYRSTPKLQFTGEFEILSISGLATAKYTFFSKSSVSPRIWACRGTKNMSRPWTALLYVYPKWIRVNELMNPEIRKFRNTKIWKYENLKIWKSGVRDNFFNKNLMRQHVTFSKTTNIFKGSNMKKKNKLSLKKYSNFGKSSRNI